MEHFLYVTLSYNKNNYTASRSCGHFCLNQRISSEMLSLRFVLETSSGLSDHAVVVGLRVVIILKNSKYNFQDARLFLAHISTFMSAMQALQFIL